MSPQTIPRTLGVLLAGGLGRRMGGGDKPLRRLGGRSLLERAIARLEPQCDALILNANGDPQRFSVLGLPVVADDVAGFAGPLAGILAALDWAANERPQIDWIVSIPTDCPFLPADLVARLHEARSCAGTPLACAKSKGRDHPVVGLWPVALRDDLRHALVVKDARKVGAWTARHGAAATEWEATPYDPFFNVNTAEDLAQAEAILAGHPAA